MGPSLSESDLITCADGLPILPSVLGANFLIIAARLLQLNGAHASAEKTRRERLARLPDHSER